MMSEIQAGKNGVSAPNNEAEEAREIVAACLAELRRRYENDVEVLQSLQEIEDVVAEFAWYNNK